MVRETTSAKFTGTFWVDGVRASYREGEGEGERGRKRAEGRRDGKREQGGRREGNGGTW